MAFSLNQSDRDTLRSAGSKVSTHASIGSLFGLGFGIYCAFRLRTMRLAYFKAFRAMEKPVEIKFADGRTRGSSTVCVLGRHPILTVSILQRLFLISPSTSSHQNGAMPLRTSSSPSEVCSLEVRLASLLAQHLRRIQLRGTRSRGSGSRGLSRTIGLMS